ncbi:MAG TPA: SH3 domain-containing protein [Coleofasciculaceae cyanobacterium]
MSLSGIFKFILGFIVGIFLLTASGAAVAYYFWSKHAVVPARPIFAEEQPKKKSATAKKVSNPQASKPASQKQPTPAQSPVKEELPPGAYKARVTWQEGLSLRDAPGSNSNRVGGVMFNQEVIVLKESDDKRWQQVRLAEGEQQGWIKAGNTERVSE